MRYIRPPKGFLFYFTIVHRVIDAVVPTLQVASTGAFCAGVSDAIEHGGSLYNALMMGGGGLGAAILTFVNSRLGSDMKQYLPYRYEKKSEWAGKELVKMGAGLQLAGNVMALSQGDYFYAGDIALALLSAYLFAGYAHYIELQDRMFKLNSNENFISESMLCWRQEDYRGFKWPRRTVEVSSWLLDRFADLALVLFSFPVVQDALDLELWKGIVIATAAFLYTSRKFFLHPRCYSDVQLLGDLALNPAQLRYQIVFFRRLSLFTVVYAPTVLIIHSGWDKDFDGGVLMSDLGNVLKGLAAFGLLMAHELGVQPARPSIQFNVSAINWGSGLGGSFGPPPSSSYGSTGSRDGNVYLLPQDQSEGLYPGLGNGGGGSAASSFLGEGRTGSDLLDAGIEHGELQPESQQSQQQPTQMIIQVVVPLPSPSSSSSPSSQSRRGLGKAASEGRLTWQSGSGSTAKSSIVVMDGPDGRAQQTDGVDKTVTAEEKQAAGFGSRLCLTVG